jgi:hypothetical protein
MVTTVLNLIIRKAKSCCKLRDLYADIYRTKLGTPRRRERAWPMRKLGAGTGNSSRVQGRETKECKITLQNI